MTTAQAPLWMSLLLPSLIALLLAIALPRLLSGLFTEGAAGLIWNLALCACLMFAASFAYFLWTYAKQDTAISALLGQNLSGSAWHFAKLALLSSMLWGPVLVLGIASLPSRWKEVEW